MHIALFNMYAYSVLGYLIQLADPPRFVQKRFDHCLQLLNKGPYHGVPTAIIQQAKRVGLPTSPMSLEHSAIASKVRVVHTDVPAFQDLWRRIDAACARDPTLGGGWTWEQHYRNQKWIDSSHIIALKKAWDYVTAIPNNPIAYAERHVLKMQPTIRRFLEEIDSNPTN